MYAYNGILFYYGSILRGETFIAIKITNAVAAIVHGNQDFLYLGSLDSKVDLNISKNLLRGMVHAERRNSLRFFI